MQPQPEVSSLLLCNDGYGSTDDTNNNDDQDNRSIHIMRRGGLKQSINDSIRNSIGHLQQSLQPFNASVREMEGTSTISNEMFNLTKNLVGAGALGIPSGFAALAGASRSGWAMIPAGFIIIVMAFIFGYYFILIGRVCKMVDASSYGEAWHESVGSRSGIWKNISFLVPLSVIGMAGLGNLAYSMILADTTRSLLSGTFGWHIGRNTCLFLVTFFVLLPLCMVKKMSVLAPFSAVGTGGIIFTMAVMALRCFDGSYEQDGEFLSSTPAELQPLFYSDEPVIPAVTDIFLLVCMCFQAFFCHYNAPRYYMELERKSIERLMCVSHVAFGVSAVTYFVIGALGYYTFGQHSAGLILNNYSANDGLALICRFAIAVSLAFTYPLPFIGTRDGILDLFSVNNEMQTSTNLNILSIVILSVITALACRFTDLGLVNAVGGGALGTAVVFVFPSIMFYSAVKKEKEASFWLKCESIMCLLLMIAGIAIGVIGVIVVVTDDSRV
ncbi:hypothetical protein ACHAXR_012188 [Thalassiosira sp. AJA248-18]